MNQYFLINGQKLLKGEVNISGAKNAALKSIAASILFEDKLKIDNVPFVEDIRRMVEILKNLGAEVNQSENNLEIKINQNLQTGLNEELSKRIRASIVLAGPILARFGKVEFPYPGGCVIGKRPIDMFLEGWAALDAEISETKSKFTVTASNGLTGADFTFRNISVTGTETMMLTAVLANGVTVIKNAAPEPEIPALAAFLNECGAKIEGAGTSVIKITGTNGKLLKSNGKKITTIPDRIEAGSFLIIGAVLGNPIKIKNCDPNHLDVVIKTLESAGVKIEKNKDSLIVWRAGVLKSVGIKTREYPGFPTDLQAPFLAIMTQAEGDSLIFETVFEGRLNYTEELIRMGARITPCDTHRVIVHGPSELHARDIESSDIRAGLAFIVAAMISKGESKVRNIYQIDRGYENIEKKLNALGADIKRVSE